MYSDGRLFQVTADHSLAEERMRHGEMTEAEAAVHPQRHILTRALGVSSDVQTDMWELQLRTGDRVLLCSDGLSNEVGMDEMADILGDVRDPEEAASRLVDVANEHGGADNITVVIVDVQVGEDGPDGASKVTPIGASTAAITIAERHRGHGAPWPRFPTVPPARRPEPDEDGPDDTGEDDAPSDVTQALPLSRHRAAAGIHRLGHPRARGSPRFRQRDENPGRGRAAQRRVLRRLGASVSVARTSTRVPLAEQTPAHDSSTKRKEKESRRERRRRLGIPRRVTFRVLGFVILVAAVPIAAYFVIRWYAYDNWIVTLQGNNVVI